MRIYKLLLLSTLAIACFSCSVYVNDGMEEPTSDPSISFDAELSSVYNYLRIDTDYDDLSWLDNEDRPYIGIPYTSSTGGKVYISDVEHTPEGLTLQSSVMAPIATSDGILKIYIGGKTTESLVDTFKFSITSKDETTLVELKAYILGDTDPESDLTFYNLAALSKLAVYEGGVPLRTTDITYDYAYVTMTFADVWGRDFYLEITTPTEFEFYKHELWSADANNNSYLDFTTNQYDKLLVSVPYDETNANVVLTIPVRIKEDASFVRAYGDDNIVVNVEASYYDYDYVNETDIYKSVSYSRNAAIKAINDMAITGMTSNIQLTKDIALTDDKYIYVDYQYGEQRTVRVETTFTYVEGGSVAASEISAETFEVQLDITDGTLFDKNGQFSIPVTGTPTQDKEIKAEVTITNITDPDAVEEITHNFDLTFTVGNPNAQTGDSSDKEEL